MKFWTTAPEAYDYPFTVDTNVRSGLKMGHIYRLVEITDPMARTRVSAPAGRTPPTRVQYQRERYLSGLHPSIPFESMTQELP